jgi:putative ABC transport system permease protein
MSESFEIRDQVRLSLARCIEFVLSGIHYRFFRSTVTVGVISLAVAFLMTMLGSISIGRGVRVAVGEMSSGRTALAFWTHALGTPLSQAEIVSTVCAPASAGRLEEIRAWAGSDADMSLLARMAPTATAYLAFFNRLSEGQNRRLLGRTRGCEGFTALQDAGVLANYRDELLTLGTPPPTSAAEFETFLADWAASLPVMERITAAHSDSIGRVAGSLEGRTLQQWLSTLGAGGVETLSKAGFRMSAADASLVQKAAADAQDVQLIESLFRTPAVKQRFAAEYGMADPSKIQLEDLFDRLASSSGAEWFLRNAGDDQRVKGLSVDSVRATARAFLHDRRVAAVEGALAGAGAGGSVSSRLVWLIVVSMVVCAVGIANAMLMSVTERFTEIATMKCLGASDGFIMVNFVLESGMQGLAGGVIGSVLGVFLAVLHSVWQYGSLAVGGVNWGLLLAEGAGCTAVGVMLSMIAAVYPAWIAARLPPMEAMRVE